MRGCQAHPSAVPSLAGRVWLWLKGLFSWIATLGMRVKFSLRSAKPLYNFPVPYSTAKLGQVFAYLAGDSIFLHASERNLLTKQSRRPAASGGGEHRWARHRLVPSVCSCRHEAVMCSAEHALMLQPRIKAAMENAARWSWVTK